MHVALQTAYSSIMIIILGILIAVLAHYSVIGGGKFSLYLPFLHTMSTTHLMQHYFAVETPSLNDERTYIPLP